MVLTKFQQIGILCLLIFSCGNKTESNNSISIATASNMQFAMKELSAKFSTNTGIDCDLIIGSSGKLTALIMEGAPYDVFVSADMKYPEALFRSGKSLSGPRVYAEGTLVLWTMTDEITPSLGNLISNQINHIAIANPKNAPYGKAAMNILEQNKDYDKIKGKLVYGESISQTNQFIISGSAEIGFTAMAVVLSPEMKNKGAWERIPSELHSPIEQGIVIVETNNLEKRTNAIKFMNFLFSEEAQEILENFGYSRRE